MSWQKKGLTKYEDNAINRVRKQRAVIDDIKHGNEMLKTDLARESREARYVTNPAAVAEIQRLQDQADLFARKIEKEKRRIEQLDAEVSATQARVLEQRQRMGGINASHENNELITKQIRILENRLDKALMKFNESLSFNKGLREKIDAARRERVVFDGIYKKLERELHEKKKEMGAIIDDSNNAYQARDKAQSEMVALRQQAVKDRDEFESEWRELSKLIEADRKLRESLRKRQLSSTGRPGHASEGTSKVEEGGMAVDGEDKGVLGEWEGGLGMGLGLGLGGKGKGGVEGEAAGRLTCEAALQKIQQETGAESLREVLTLFVESEERNFSLFNYINDLNTEIERLEIMIGETRGETEKYKGQGVSTDTQRKKVLRGLEEQLARTQDKADDFDTRYQAAMKTVNALKTGIHGIFTRIASGGGASGTMEEVLGNQGVTESNMLQYLGLIEQRTGEILATYASSQNISRPTEEAQVVSGQGGMAANGGSSDEGLMGAGAGGSSASPNPATGSRKLVVQPPSWDDYSSGEEDEVEDDERPLTRDELKNKTLRAANKLAAGGGGGVLSLQLPLPEGVVADPRGGSNANARGGSPKRVSRKGLGGEGS